MTVACCPPFSPDYKQSRQVYFEPQEERGKQMALKGASATNATRQVRENKLQPRYGHLVLSAVDKPLEPLTVPFHICQFGEKKEASSMCNKLDNLQEKTVKRQAQTEAIDCFNPEVLQTSAMLSYNDMSKRIPDVPRLESAQHVMFPAPQPQASTTSARVAW